MWRPQSGLRGCDFGGVKAGRDRGGLAPISTVTSCTGGGRSSGPSPPDTLVVGVGVMGGGGGGRRGGGGSKVRGGGGGDLVAVAVPAAYTPVGPMHM